jgi:DNA-binding LacI/PurR family transcriptional regulator
MAKDSKITVQKIAEAAGVSTATVSRVLNNKATVNEATRRKILEVMENLDYSFTSPGMDPDSRSILLYVPDMTNPFNSLIIEGIRQSAVKNQFRLFILQSKENFLTYEDYDYALKNHSFRGVILLSTATNTKLLELLSMSCPIVMCSNYCDVKGISFVSIDDVSAARKATEYLISCGCKRIALLNFSQTFRFARLREQGYAEALHKAGLFFEEDLVAHISAINYGLAYSYCLDILSRSNPPDGFFAISDVYAVAAIHAAKKKGFRVPQDISVVGFDNIELSSMTDPALTTIEQPMFKIGNQACELLVEKINNPRVTQKRIILDTELIVRESTANAGRLMR